MRVICSNCTKVLGEKCAKCGKMLFSFDQTGMKIIAGLQNSPNTNIIGFHCYCGHNWKPGDDPISHGLCPECYSQEVTALEEIFRK
jgi:RNA polymerase subunit RPABC4/transcription elongation factor Spt4